MNQFSEFSWSNLDSCDPRLREIFVEVIKGVDCRVTCGHRNREDQNFAYDEGMSQLKWPLSKHNKLPSMAVDVIPYPVDWTDRERFHHLAGYVKAIAKTMDIDIIWGGDWNFKDLPHYELRKA